MPFCPASKSCATVGIAPPVEISTSLMHDRIAESPEGKHPSDPVTHNIPPCQTAEMNLSSLIWTTGTPPGCRGSGGIDVAWIGGSVSVPTTLPAVGVPVIATTPTVGLPVLQLDGQLALL